MKYFIGLCFGLAQVACNFASEKEIDVGLGVNVAAAVVGMRRLFF